MWEKEKFMLSKSELQVKRGKTLWSAGKHESPDHNSLTFELGLSSESSANVLSKLENKVMKNKMI